MKTKVDLPFVPVIPMTREASLILKEIEPVEDAMSRARACPRVWAR